MAGAWLRCGVRVRVFVFFVVWCRVMLCVARRCSLFFVCRSSLVVSCRLSFVVLCSIVLCCCVLFCRCCGCWLLECLWMSCPLLLCCLTCWLLACGVLTASCGLLFASCLERELERRVFSSLFSNFISLHLCLSSSLLFVSVWRVLCCAVLWEKGVCIEHVSVCSFKTSPCVPAPRPHVCDMWAWSWYTRGTF